MGGKRWAVAVMAAVVAIGGCATTSPSLPAVTNGSAATQTLRISTHEWALRPAAFPGGLARYERREIRDAQCTAVNEQGAWTVATPGELQVPRPGSPLKIACRKEGYRESSVEVRCMTPGERGAIEGMLFGLRIFGGAAPAAGVVAGVLAGSTALGAAIGSASVDAGACRYAIVGEIEVWLRPERS